MKSRRTRTSGIDFEATPFNKNSLFRSTLGSTQDEDGEDDELLEEEQQIEELQYNTFHQRNNNLLNTAKSQWHNRKPLESARLQVYSAELDEAVRKRDASSSSLVVDAATNSGSFFFTPRKKPEEKIGDRGRTNSADESARKRYEMIAQVQRESRTARSTGVVPEDFDPLRNLVAPPALHSPFRTKALLEGGKNGGWIDLQK
ncbi:unnamed protein product [Amoebophrya sp. A25]|nr:unnamed protein product [Amoebophrya sp. A25]|eukprot:GSA25T00022356001.1